MRKRDSSNLVNKVIVYGLLLIAAISVLLYIYFSNEKPLYYKRTEYLLGTYVTVNIASDGVSSVELASTAFQEIERIDSKFSKDSKNMRSINTSDGNWVSVDEETFSIIEACLEVSNNTDGAFDPTVYRLVKLWGFESSNSTPSVSSNSRINEVIETVGYRNIVIDEENCRIKLLNDAMVDLSGIAKGYAVDKAIEVIKSINPGATGYIDAGGDIGIIGPKYGERPWVIGIRHPRSDRASDAIEYLKMFEGAVATSGDYERYFIEKGIRYHHLIDPKTGRPARNNTISSTVINKSAMLADAYATAAFIMGKSPGVTFLPRYGSLVLLIQDDLSIYKTPGIESYIGK
ncbi:MAG: FAD:protein FMN transferase [Kosmotoga sp.]|nr:MAG: FAD:protein FMN transferase [Kosmotoga sp.]